MVCKYQRISVIWTPPPPMLVLIMIEKELVSLFKKKYVRFQKIIPQESFICLFFNRMSANVCSEHSHSHVTTDWLFQWKTFLPRCDASASIYGGGWIFLHENVLFACGKWSSSSRNGAFSWLVLTGMLIILHQRIVLLISTLRSLIMRI